MFPMLKQQVSPPLNHNNHHLSPTMYHPYTVKISRHHSSTQSQHPIRLQHPPSPIWILPASIWYLLYGPTPSSWAHHPHQWFGWETPILHTPLTSPPSSPLQYPKPQLSSPQEDNQQLWIFKFPVPIHRRILSYHSCLISLGVSHILGIYNLSCPLFSWNSMEVFKYRLDLHVSLKKPVPYHQNMQQLHHCSLALPHDCIFKANSPSPHLHYSTTISTSLH